MNLEATFLLISSLKNGFKKSPSKMRLGAKGHSNMFLRYFLRSGIDWMWVFPSPKFIHWNLIPNVIVLGSRAFGRWSLRWSHHQLDWGLYKREPRELPHPLCHVRTQWKDGHLWAIEQALIRQCICWHLSIGLPSFRTVRNKFLLLISLPVYCPL